MAAEYQRVAQISKTKSKQGRLIVRSVDGLPFLLYEGVTAWVVPPLLKGPRVLTVSQIDYQGDDFVVSFDEVDSMDTAETLPGKYLLIAKDDIDPEMLIEDEFEALDFAVIDDEFGDLGVVVDLLEGEFQDVLVVEGEYGEILIPYVEQFIELIDYDQELVRVSIPRSLLELQQPSGDEE